MFLKIEPHRRALRNLMVERDWHWEARQLLKREMDAAGVGYAELAGSLRLKGIKVTAKSLSTKLNRGTFTLAFFLQCLDLMKVDEVKLRR